MDILDKLVRGKINMANIAVIVVSLLFANYLNGMQQSKKTFISDKIKKETEKNSVLSDISRSEKIFIGLKNIINKEGLDGIINDVYFLARETAVSVTALKPGDENEAGDFLRRPYNLTVTGTYHNIGKFISKLESSPFIYIVENLNMHALEKEGKGEESPVVQLTADLKIGVVRIKE